MKSLYILLNVICWVLVISFLVLGFYEANLSQHALNKYVYLSIAFTVIGIVLKAFQKTFGLREKSMYETNINPSTPLSQLLVGFVLGVLIGPIYAVSFLALTDEAKYEDLGLLLVIPVGFLMTFVTFIIYYFVRRMSKGNRMIIDSAIITSCLIILLTYSGYFPSLTKIFSTFSRFIFGIIR